MLQTMIDKLRRLRYTPRRAKPPQWRIQLAEVEGEMCNPKARLFVINPTPTPERAIAHAGAHIYLNHHHQPGDFTEQDCVDADDQARLWLDEIDITAFHNLPSLDGEPTVIGLV